ncbi:hypothetical protein ACFVXG_27440 [Kitasatospora sp. NPDC058162]|uniref:hypothetical protein n=1 Tax=Kitasatospora sp. NPDC058162 TaxID=3346362 RepID=UPI0036DE38AC
MSGHLFTRRADRPWPIALFAAATWVQPWVTNTHHINPWLIALWLVLGALTALPLLIADPVRFRQACLTVGGLLLGLEVLISLPFLLIILPFYVALFPAGALLLLAGWRRRGPARGILTAVLLVVPCLMAVTSLLPR